MGASSVTSGDAGTGPQRRRRRGVWRWLSVAACATAGAWLALSSLPADARTPDGEWVQHRVLFGERLSDIAERHGVQERAIIRWNKLDAERPRIRAGSHLRIRSRLLPPERERRVHVVKRGESWSSIARRYEVSERALRRHWNRHRKRDGLRAGEELVVWVDAEEPDLTLDLHEVESLQQDAAPAPAPPSDAAAPAATAAVPSLVSTALGATVANATPQDFPGFPIIEVPRTALSVGNSDRGRLRHGLRLPDNPALYTIRNPAHAYGSSHAIMQLQTAVARFRAHSGYTGPLVIHDMSRRRGGRLPPHRSHRNGRDVDIRLPSVPSLPEGELPLHIQDVDWDAAWSLVDSLLQTGQVQYIFLSRSRQRHLRRAALRAGMDEAVLAELMEYPRFGGPMPVRHARGHEKHIHVRFKCAPWEKRCR